MKIFEASRNKLKLYFINTKLYLLIEPIIEYILKLTYIFKFAKWYHENHLQEFHIIKQKKMQYSNRYKLYQFILESEKLETEIIDFLEFGVSSGSSLKWWIKKNKSPKSKFIGFDTFYGLPEDWDDKHKGMFTTGGKLPELQDNRCHYEVGLFQDTLFKFLEKFTFDRKTIIHLDADLYSSTLFVLTTLASKLKQGDIIIFDEFTTILHEFRAFQDFTSAYFFNYKILGTVNNCHQIAFMVT